jgi:hypothetical protein
MSFTMTASELEQAIAMAFAMVGRSSPTEERYHAAMSHLRELLAIQRKRAAQMEAA